MQQTLTHEQKMILYEEGNFICNVPPVCHVKWDREAWIKFIDAEGAWKYKGDYIVQSDLHS